MCPNGEISMREPAVQAERKNNKQIYNEHNEKLKISSTVLDLQRLNDEHWCVSDIDDCINRMCISDETREKQNESLELPVYYPAFGTFDGYESEKGILDVSVSEKEKEQLSRPNISDLIDGSKADAAHKTVNVKHAATDGVDAVPDKVETEESEWHWKEQMMAGQICISLKVDTVFASWNIRLNVWSDCTLSLVYSADLHYCTGFHVQHYKGRNNSQSISTRRMYYIGCTMNIWKNWMLLPNYRLVSAGSSFHVPNNAIRNFSLASPSCYLPTNSADDHKSHHSILLPHTDPSTIFLNHINGFHMKTVRHPYKSRPNNNSSCEGSHEKAAENGHRGKSSGVASSNQGTRVPAQGANGNGKGDDEDDFNRERFKWNGVTERQSHEIEKTKRKRCLEEGVLDWLLDDKSMQPLGSDEVGCLMEHVSIKLQPSNEIHTDCLVCDVISNHIQHCNNECSETDLDKCGMRYRVAFIVTRLMDVANGRRENIVSSSLPVVCELSEVQQQLTRLLGNVRDCRPTNSTTYFAGCVGYDVDGGSNEEQERDEGPRNVASSPERQLASTQQAPYSRPSSPVEGVDDGLQYDSDDSDSSIIMPSFSNILGTVERVDPGVQLMLPAFQQQQQSPYDRSVDSGAGAAQHRTPGRVRYGTIADLQQYGHRWASYVRNGSNVDLRQLQSEGIILEDARMILNPSDDCYEEDVEWFVTSDAVGIGCGVSGKCYACVDVTSEAAFCVKKVHLLRFEADELIVWSQLQCRDHVVTLYGAMLWDEHVYIFQELIRGPTLHEWIQRNGSLNSHDALFLLQRLLQILVYLKSQSVIHNDIKADNIMLRLESDNPVMIDFGLSCRSQFVRRDTNAVGSQLHWSPEKAASLGYDFSADLWAAICVFVHMLSGSEPWKNRYESTVRVLHYVIYRYSPPLEDIPQDLPPDIYNLIVQGWTVDASQRPSAEQLLNHPAFRLLNAPRCDPMFSGHLPSLGQNFVISSVAETVEFDEFEGEELIAQVQTEIISRDSERVEQRGLLVQQVSEEIPVVAPEPPETVSEPKTQQSEPTIGLEAVENQLASATVCRKFSQRQEHKTDRGVVDSLCGNIVLPGVLISSQLVLETSGDQDVFRVDPSVLAHLIAHAHLDQEPTDEPVDRAVDTVSEANANAAAAAAPTNNPVAAPIVGATFDGSVSNEAALPEWDRCGARPKTVPRSNNHLFSDESSDGEEHSRRRPTGSKRRSSDGRKRDDEVQLVNRNGAVTLPSSFVAAAKPDDVNDDLPTTSFGVPLPTVSPAGLSGSCQIIPAHILDWTVSDDEETVEMSSPSVQYSTEGIQMNQDQEVKGEQQQLQQDAVNCVQADGVFSDDELSLEESGLFSQIDEARNELQSMVRQSSSLVSSDLRINNDSQSPDANPLDNIMAELRGTRQMVDRSLSSASLMDLPSFGTTVTMTYNGIAVYGLQLHNGCGTRYCWKEVMQRAAASNKLTDLSLGQFTGRLANGVEIALDDDVPNVGRIEVIIECVFDGNTEGDTTWHWKMDSSGQVWYRNVQSRFSLD